MWLSKRRNFLALISAVALTGCGFTPVYAPGGAGAQLQGAVFATDPTTRDEQLLAQQLESRLGRATTARYLLDYQLEVSQQRMAVLESNTTARFNLIGEVKYQLKDADTEATLFTGSARQFTGYSTTGTTAATISSERDARARLSVILADQIVAQLLLNTADLGL